MGLMTGEGVHLFLMTEIKIAVSIRYIVGNIGVLQICVEGEVSLFWSTYLWWNINLYGYFLSEMAIHIKQIYVSHLML